jgi:hypothetical protein
MNYEALGLDENFQGTCFDHVFFQSMLVCYNWWKNLQKCCFFNQVYTIRFVEIYNKPKKFTKRT